MENSYRGVSLHQPGPVGGLKLKTDRLLLGSDNVSIGGSVKLRLLLQGDLSLDSVNLVLSDGSEVSLLLVKLLVDFSGPVGADLRTNIFTDRRKKINRRILPA